MVKLVQMAKGYTFCHIKSLWKQYSSPILNNSECVKNYFVCFKKFDFGPDPEMNPDPDPDLDPELPEESDSDQEIIFSDPTHWL